MNADVYARKINFNLNIINTFCALSLKNGKFINNDFNNWFLPKGIAFMIFLQFIVECRVKLLCRYQILNGHKVGMDQDYAQAQRSNFLKRPLSFCTKIVGMTTSRS